MSIVEGEFPYFNCAEDVKSMVVTVRYRKTVDTKLEVRFKGAVFCGTSISEDILFGDDGELTYDHPYVTDGASSSCGTDNTPSDDGWGDDATFAHMDINPVTGDANMVYAWQAGGCDGQERILRVSTEDDAGCGYFGYASDISLEGEEIESMICNWAAPGAEPIGQKTDRSFQDLVQRQCFELNTTTGVMESVADDLNIVYAPVLDCGNSSTLTCDGTACPTTHDLLPIAQMSVTELTELPAMPAAALEEPAASSE